MTIREVLDSENKVSSVEQFFALLYNQKIHPAYIVFSELPINFNSLEIISGVDGSSTFFSFTDKDEDKDLLSGYSYSIYDFDLDIDNKTFKKLDEYTQEHIETIYNTYDKDLPPHWAIEQYIPAQFFLQNNFKIKELREYENYQIRRSIGVIRLYEMQNFSLVHTRRMSGIDIKDVLTKYMKENIGHHLWISKSVDGIEGLLINVCNEMFPEVYDKINNIVDKNFPINTKPISLI